MLALLCKVDMVQCAQSHVAPPAAESFLIFPLTPLYEIVPAEEGDVPQPPAFFLCEL